MTLAPLKVDIVSDVVCPWCAIGYNQLRIAAEQIGQPLEITWHPFELNPQMPPEGQDLREHIAQKYGTSPEESVQARARLTALGEELGFTFNYRDDSRMRNTFEAHQVIHFAGEAGKQHEMKLALLKAFFTDQRDVSDREVLADVAASIGLDAGAVTEMLDSGRLIQTVRQEEQFWTQQGISGVPSMVFARKYLVTGAQGVDNYLQILQQVAAEAA
ncbi:DsbA family oxidoreductase [Sagittula sp. SSi028]|uniref:DsbA family oxidoreductase n=1 Tax=Sagittula sp. SSi028 TaxID=3400636 RepID=UPI003AF44E89